jgi:uncharacterized protein
LAKELYKITGLISPLESRQDARSLLATHLGVSVNEIGHVEILRKSLDARKKPNLKFIWSLAFELESGLLRKGIPAVSAFQFPVEPDYPEMRLADKIPIVIGAGPAGQFAALGFVLRGYKPIILERGNSIIQRSKDVKRLWNDRQLNPDSNVQFGEGGAGTFSDGKLTSRGSNWFTRKVLQTMVELGCPQDVIYSHLPHIGSDGVRKFSARFRKYLEERGAEFRFGSRVEALQMENGKVGSVRLNSGEVISAKTVVLAIGHSSRDTITNLHSNGLEMEAKGFAMGLRVEHPREMINVSQYGKSCNFELTGTANYKLTASAGKSSKSVYSFCMCPGGMVVLSSSIEDTLVVNGMSWSKRDMDFSNSALVTGVSPVELQKMASEMGFQSNALSGFAVQHAIEEIAFIEAGSNYNAPAQNAFDFVNNRKTKSFQRTSYLPEVSSVNIHDVMPKLLTEPISAALHKFERQIKGFMAEGTLIAPETRTSSPIRILRDPQTRESVSHPGLFPVGEGAGYSGGIISSAADGLRTTLGFPDYS